MLRLCTTLCADVLIIHAHRSIVQRCSIKEFLLYFVERIFFVLRGMFFRAKCTMKLSSLSYASLFPLLVRGIFCNS